MDTLSHDAIDWSRPRRPLVPVPMASVAAALAAGILAGRLGPLTAGTWAIWAGAALAVAALLTARRRRGAVVFLLAGVFALGAYHLRLAWFRLPDDHIVHWTLPARTMATVRGRVSGWPSVYASAGFGGRAAQMTGFDLDAEAVLTGDGWRRVRGEVGVMVLEGAEHVARGQEVELIGWLGRYAGPDNPGQWDVRAAARRAGKLVTFRVPGADGVIVRREAPRSAAGAWLARLRRSARALLGGGGGRGGAVLEALVLGRRDPSLEPLREAMARAGVAHLLSISGMHLGIFLGFVYLVCRLAGLAPRPTAAVALLCLAGYLLLAELRSPLMRSAVMALIVCLGVLAGRRRAAPNALAVAAVVLLAADPRELFAPGFQLSFTVVAALLTLTGPLRRLLFGRWLRRRGLMVFRGGHRLRRWLYYVAAEWGINAVTMALLAWAASAPLIAMHFGLVSPLGPLLTLPLTVLVILALLPGYAALAAALAAPGLGAALAALAARPAEWMARGVEAIDGLGPLAWHPRPVHWPWVAGCYAAGAVVVLHRRLRWGRAWAAGAVLLAAGLTVQTQWTAGAPEVAELSVLAVGAGQCAVLRTPSNRTVMLDAGSLGRGTVGERILLPFLRHRRLPHPSAAAVSHADSDHYNALPALLDRGGIETLYLNPYFGLAGKDPAVGVTDLLWRLRQGGGRVVRLAAGDRVRLGPRTEMQVLWPPAGRDIPSGNDRSLVLRIVCDGRSVLVPGDIGEAPQAALARAPQRIASDVLILPHHGAWTAALPAFVEAVSPEAVVVSTSRRLSPPRRAGEAGRAFYAGLLARDTFSTDSRGCVEVRFGRRKVDVRTTRR